jgi:hypothetical protein
VYESGHPENGDVKPPEEFSFPLGEAFKSSGIIPEKMHSRQFNEKEVNGE